MRGSALGDAMLLRAFRDRLAHSEQRALVAQLRPLLANRVIDAYWHAENEQLSTTYPAMMRQDLLQGRFFE